MHWCKHFIVDIALEEVESPPWDGWCPILARGQAWDSGWFWLKFFFFNWYTFFCLPDKANTPARNFWIWQKIGLDPLVLFSVKPLKQKMWRWGDNWCSNWNQSTYTCTQIKMKYAWGGRGQGSKAGFDSKGLIGSVTSHYGLRIFSNRFLKEVVK